MCNLDSSDWEEMRMSLEDEMAATALKNIFYGLLQTNKVN